MNIIPSIPLYIKTWRAKYRKRSWGWIVLSINSYCERKPKTLHTWLSICAGLLNFQIAFRAAIPFTFYYDMQNMWQPQYCHKKRWWNRHENLVAGLWSCSKAKGWSVFSEVYFREHMWQFSIAILGIPLQNSVWSNSEW